MNQTKRINRDLMIGWLVIVLVLTVAYILEVVRGERDILYFGIFLAVNAIPLAISYLRYKKNQEDDKLRYFITIGFSLNYIFVMLTGNTVFVFCYVLPLVALIVLYHDWKLVLYIWIGVTLLNVGVLFIWKERNMLLGFREHEIQLASVFLCFMAAFFAAKIYDDIYKENQKYNEILAQKNDQMKQMTMQTVMTIANTIDAKDEYTRGHSRRVAEYSAAIAREMHVEPEIIEDIRFIGLLHDIGKIGVPDMVLNKPGRLTDEEYQLMKDHTTIGGEILKDITMISNLDVGAKHHHERFDGSGYPEGLKGEEIPFIARIIGVADAYDAMTSNRVYRKHLDSGRVVNELRKGKGTQFDPEICEVMLRLIEEERLPKVDINNDSREVKQTTKILTRVIDKAEDRAVDESNRDELTGAFSKNQGKSAIQQAIENFGKGSIFIIDIDQFKKINETEGYAVGDQYLKTTADMIRQIIGEDYLTRFGGDEFMVYLPELESAEEAENLANYFISELRELAEEDFSLSKLSVCIGITQIATEKDKVMVAYENANRALYVAKQCGTGSFFCHRLEGDDEDIAIAESVDLKQLVEAMNCREEMEGSYSELYPSLGDIYDAVARIMEKNENKVHAALFTMMDSHGEISMDERRRVMELLEKSIRTVMQNEDHLLKFSGIQRLILFANMDENEIRTRLNKILSDFYKVYDRRDMGIHYDVADLSRN